MGRDFLGERGDRCRGAVSKLAQIVRAAIDWAPNDALANGRLGCALFAYSAGDALDDESLCELAGDLLMACAEEPRIEGLSLADGACGLAFALELLRPAFNYGDSDPCDAIDQALLARLSSPSLSAADLTHGELGFGAYALVRSNQEARSKLLRGVMDSLSKTASATAAGVHWYIPQNKLPPEYRSRYPEGRSDIGMSHGLAGAVAFLSLLYRRGELNEGSHSLLEQAAEELQVRCRLKREPLRLDQKSWCNGEPGVLFALLSYARAVGREHEDLVQRFFELATLTPRECIFRESCVCHGSAGMLLILLQAYELTEDGRFLPGIQRWTDIVLSEVEAIQQTSVAGDADDFARQAGLMFGASGVGLVLTDLLSEEQWPWRHFFLLG